jgi:type II secretory pathway component PulK
MTARRGFTMITTLWVMTVASIVAMAGVLAGRMTVNVGRNRVQSERAYWVAVGCARRAQARIDDRLGEASIAGDETRIWRTLDQSVLPAVLSPSSPCDLRLEAAGTRLDLNTATPQMLAALLRTIGETDVSAAQMADALVDWRDSDQVVSPLGAERPWYLAVARATPRDGPFPDIRELALVRGFEISSRFEPYFTTEPGRVSLGHASAEVLAAIPGFTRETADLIAMLAREGTPVVDAASIVGRVSTQSASELMAHYPEIVRTTTGDPDAWLLEVRAWNGNPKSTVVLQWRVLRAGHRCVVVSSRTSL